MKRGGFGGTHRRGKSGMRILAPQVFLFGMHAHTRNAKACMHARTHVLIVLDSFWTRLGSFWDLFRDRFDVVWVFFGVRFGYRWLAVLGRLGSFGGRSFWDRLEVILVA